MRNSCLYRKNKKKNLGILRYNYKIKVGNNRRRQKLKKSFCVGLKQNFLLISIDLKRREKNQKEE